MANKLGRDTYHGAGEIAKHLMSVRGGGKLSKPSVPLRVSAYVEVPSNNAPSMAKYDKEDLARTKKEVSAIEQALETWVPEDVAARAKRSLETELKAKKARIEELKARIEGAEDVPDDESEEDEAEEAEE